MLKPFNYTSANNCLTYVLKRTGLYEEIVRIYGYECAEIGRIFFERFKGNITEILDWDKELLFTGDILIAEKLTFKSNSKTVSISSDARLIIDLFPMPYHYMVYEEVEIDDYQEKIITDFIDTDYTPIRVRKFESAMRDYEHWKLHKLNFETLKSRLER